MSILPGMIAQVSDDGLSSRPQCSGFLGDEAQCVVKPVPLFVGPAVDHQNLRQEFNELLTGEMVEPFRTNVDRLHCVTVIDGQSIVIVFCSFPYTADCLRCHQQVNRHRLLWCLPCRNRPSFHCCCYRHHVLALPPPLQPKSKLRHNPVAVDR